MIFHQSWPWRHELKMLSKKINLVQCYSRKTVGGALKCTTSEMGQFGHSLKHMVCVLPKAIYWNIVLTVRCHFTKDYQKPKQENFSKSFLEVSGGAFMLRWLDCCVCC
ncbi:hypothetical protein CIPAW_15G174000 [Carya illinoinensis]|uniref:Uncharacterized protein n=1 Tax=Carya illinoinensis TaxID=32201 RepID=A0A8T1NEH8_CARIL|nr:hypothetical protein CIPAW_15G174000 [Carya illinoinensis]